MRVFITGAGGFIGSHLTRALRCAGHEVTAMGHYRGAPQKVDVLGDIRDPERMRDLIKGHDLVYHLAALIDVPYSYVSPRSYVDTNVAGTLNVALACIEAGARLVHTSTSEVYGTAVYTPQDESHPIQPQSPYAASKVGADAIVRSLVLSSGLKAVILRPFNTYGSGQSERAVIARIMAQWHQDVVVMGDPTPTRDFVHVSDTVRAFMSVEPSLNCETYNAATGTSTSIRELVDMLVPTKHVVWTKQRPEASEVQRLCGDASKLTAATGWTPTVSLRDGLLEMMR